MRGEAIREPGCVPAETAGRLTVAAGQFFLGDGVVFGRVQLDGHLGLKALGLGLVFNHCWDVW